MFLLLSEGSRTHSFVAFEEGAEMGLVLETELVGYLLYGFSCGKEQCFCPLDKDMFNTSAGSYAKRLFDGVGYVACGEAKLVGIPIERVLLLTMGIHKVHKSACYLFVAGHFSGVLLREMIGFFLRQIV